MCHMYTASLCCPEDNTKTVRHSAWNFICDRHWIKVVSFITKQPHLLYFFIFYFFFLFKELCICSRGRKSVLGAEGGTEREGERGKRSRLPVIRSEPHLGLGLRTLSSWSLPKSRVGRLTDWATQGPHNYMSY